MLAYVLFSEALLSTNNTMYAIWYKRHKYLNMDQDKTIVLYMQKQ
jgi:hypothetical protein